MSCEVCTKVSGSANVMIPTDLGLEMKKMCITCAVNSGHFCPQHQTQHMLFADNTSACPYCTHEGVQELARKGTSFHTMLALYLNSEQWEHLTAEIPHPPGTAEFERSVSKMVVTAAQRHKVPRQNVILRLVNDKDWHHIIVPPILAVPAA